MIEQVPRDQMHDLAVAFDHALYAEEPRAEQLASLPFGEAIPHHDVDAPGFVLEGDEDDAARGVGALPASDQAGNARRAAVGAQPELFCREQLKLVQSASQQRERMAAESQPEAGVVGDAVLAIALRAHA